MSSPLPEHFKKTKVSNNIECAYRGVDKHAKIEEVQQWWEELEGIYQASAQAIVGMGEGVRDSLQYQAVVDRVVDQKELNIAVSGLMADLTRFSKDLQVIHKLHEGRKGLIVSDDEHADSLGIYDAYMNFNIQYQSIVLPTYAIITEHLAAALEVLNKEVSEQEAANLTNVNVVSDIEPVVKTEESTPA